jgi:RNA polymerase sigma-70 factor, ECF subfamily
MDAEKNMAKGPQPREAQSRPLEGADLESVIERARRHDVEALEEVYHRYVRRIFGLCRYLLGSSDSAEDATSEVFLKLQHSIDSYDGSTSFPKWLLRVAGNGCIDVIRRRQRGRRVIVEVEDGAAVIEVPSPEPSPLRAIITKEERAQVRDTIARLPEKYRVPLVLRYYSELTYSEIAQQLGLEKNNVALLIFRAKQEMRRRLAHKE